jgi:hypothetical protein
VLLYCAVGLSASTHTVAPQVQRLSSCCTSMSALCSHGADHAITAHGFAYTLVHAVVDHGRVPIIKAIAHRGAHSFNVDISIDGPAHTGLATTAFVACLVERLPALAPLVLVLKHLLQSRGLKCPYTGGLSSYALTLMATYVVLQEQRAARCTAAATAAAATAAASAAAATAAASSSGASSSSATCSTNGTAAAAAGFARRRQQQQQHVQPQQQNGHSAALRQSQCTSVAAAAAAAATATAAAAAFGQPVRRKTGSLSPVRSTRTHSQHQPPQQQQQQQQQQHKAAHSQHSHYPQQSYKQQHHQQQQQQQQPVNVWDRVTQQQWVGARTAQAILLQGYFPAAQTSAAVAAAAAAAATTVCTPLVMTSTSAATSAGTTAVSGAPAACTVTAKPTAAAAAEPVSSLHIKTHAGIASADAVHTAAAISFEEQLQALELGDSPLSSPLHSAPSQRHQQQQQQQSYTNSASYNNIACSSHSSTGRDSEPCLGTLLLDFLHLFSHEFEAGSEGLSVRGGGFRFPLDCGLSHPQASDPIVIEVRTM